jgi:Pentapeptide repeats (8 copies)
MPNSEQLALVKRPVAEWNQWRSDNPDVVPDLSRASLFRQNLTGANLSNCEFNNADLSEAKLVAAKLIGANLRGARLCNGDLMRADLTGADLTGANLSYCRFVRTKVEKASFSNCYIYGISVWGSDGEPQDELNLVITPDSEPILTVDYLDVAQFVYLILHNEKIRSVIQTIGRKAVLILGRFTTERKAVLEAIREEIRKLGYLPILFTFDPLTSQTTMETVSTLAHLSRFVIADLTDTKSIIGELERIVTSLPSLPVQPLLHASCELYGMADSILVREMVSPLLRYNNLNDLFGSLLERVVGPAETKAAEFETRLAEIRQNRTN